MWKLAQSCPEDLLRLVILDARGQRLWAQQVKAVPRVGEDVSLHNAQGEMMLNAQVMQVIWGFNEGRAGQSVAIIVGEPSAPPLDDELVVN
jgi:hypothetical protein